MFDEPSLGLAPVIVKQVFKIIKQINATGTTILLIEQNARQALGISNHTYVLENGHIILDGPSKQCLGNSVPLSSTEPLSGRTRPEIALTREVLPAPLAPMMLTIFPVGTVILTSCRASMCP